MKKETRNAIIVLVFGLLVFFLVKVVLADDVSCRTYRENPNKYFGYLLVGVNAAPREPMRERSLEDLWLATENQCKIHPDWTLSKIVEFNRGLSEALYAPKEGWGWIIYTVDGKRMLSEKWTHRYTQLNERKSIYGKDIK